MESETYYCGEMVAREGLEAVARLLTSCSWPISLRRSRRDDSLALYARTDEIDLEMPPGQSRSFLFSGSVSGSAAQALQRLEELSALLAGGKVTHRLEIYPSSSSSEKSGYLHYGWPEEKPADPDLLESLSLALPWERTTESLENQLYRELTPEHPLFGIAARAIARRIDNDDVLFALSSPSSAILPLAVVHLGWTLEATPSALFPTTEFFASLEEWVERGGR